MKITICGSGVIGTTAAYYQARAGHEVTVLDRQTGPALETSFANAGEISPGSWIPSAGARWSLSYRTCSPKVVTCHVPSSGPACAL